MFLNKIWQRYFFGQLIKSTLFFLLAFFGLYSLIDYANHAASMHKHHLSFNLNETLLYYISELVRRMNVLLPFALLIGSIRTLCSLNANNELIALMSTGLSKKTLLRPFLMVGLFCTLFIYLNTELFLPRAVMNFKKIEDSRSHKSKYIRPANAQHLSFEDNTLLLFQNYDSSQERFFDAYWIINGDEIYRIKYLYPNLASNQPPTGRYVDHLIRNAQGDMINQESSIEKSFPKLKFNQEALFETLTAPEEQSFSELWEKIPKNKESASEKESQAMAAFYYKLIIPWLCLFAIIGPAPFCLVTTRNLRVFFIYAGCIFAFVAIDLILNAGVLLAKRQALSPIFSIWTPFLFFSLIIGYRFSKVK